MEKGKMVVISGPSGAGKGTVIKKIIDELPDTELSISMTTRPMRQGEVDGTHYYFVSDAQFQQRLQENGFLEYAKVYGNYYGTPREMVLDKLEQGTNIILEIDVQGAMKIKEAYPKALFVFLLPPSMRELRRRIETRGTDEQSVIEHRMREAVNEIKAAVNYDYAIVNDDLEKAADELKAIINGEKTAAKESINVMIRKYEEEEQ